MCGWYCLYFIDFLKKTKNIEEVIKNFNKKDVEKNDDILKKHFNIKDF